MYSIREIASILDADYIGPSEDFLVKNVLTDSRKLYKNENILFVAIGGKNHNGHHFIESMYSKGLRAFLVEEEITHPHPDAHYLKVKSCLGALQKVAQYRRVSLAYPILAITGSNGKTIVKEWLNQLLAPQMKLSRSPRSYNSQLGVPLSLWGLAEKSELGIIETGISKPGEMQVLAEIADPELGLITNIGEAHAANFESRQHKLEEKLALFETCRSIFFSEDQEEVSNTIKRRYGSKDLISWSSKGPAFVQLKKTQTKNAQTSLVIRFEAQDYRVSLPFIDHASIENFMHCFTVAAYLEADMDMLLESAATLNEVSMRAEILKGKNGSLIINDSYSSDLHSLSNALEILGSQVSFDKRTAILSDIDDTGLNSANLCDEIAGMLKAHKVDRLIAIGKTWDSQQSKFEFLEAKFYPDTKVALSGIYLPEFKERAVLIKGGRRFNLEKITKELQEKEHSTLMEIKLNSVKHNLEVYRSLLKPETKIMAMVKAFGYGTGDYEVALKLEQSSVDYLGVAFTDEGVSLRKRGLNSPIVVLNPEPENYHSLLKYKLEPEIYSLRTLKNFIAHLLESHEVPKAAYPIHLNIDSGMHRLGFLSAEIEELISVLNQSDAVVVESIFTHLSSADDPEAKEFTLGQLSSFDAIYNQLSEALGYKPIKHALNSAGVELYAEHQFDMVRVGLGLYGIANTKGLQSRLEPAISFRAKVLQIKEIEKGEPIGYSRAYFTEEDMRIATVSVGYADGFKRSLGNGVGALIYKGAPCKTVGNICMDMTMVQINDNLVSEGEELEVFGNKQSIVELAKRMGTIPYEVLTSIPSRVKRIYSEE